MNFEGLLVLGNHGKLDLNVLGLEGGVRVDEEGTMVVLDGCWDGTEGCSWGGGRGPVEKVDR